MTMPYAVWCLMDHPDIRKATFSVAVEPASESGICTVDDLRQLFQFNPPARLSWLRFRQFVNIFANKSATTPLSPDTPLRGLGQQEQEPLIAKLFSDTMEMWCKERREQIDARHSWPRLKLLHRLATMVTTSQFAFVEGEPHVGKSALIDLLATAYSDRFNFVYASLRPDNCTSRPAKLLDEAGINLEKHSFWRPFAGVRKETTIVVVDDAEEAYADTAFWRQLLVEMPMGDWLPSTFHFVIVVRPVMDQATIPEQLRNSNSSVPRLLSQDLRLSEEEAKAVLLAAMPDVFTSSREQLLYVVIQYCNGNWGLLADILSHCRCCVHFPLFSSKTSVSVEQFTEGMWIREVLSFKVVDGSTYDIEATPARGLLMRCLGSAPQPTALLESDDHDACAKLVHSGILRMSVDTTRVQFLAPMRETWALSRLFPVRAFLCPTSLDDVVQKAIQHVDTMGKGELATPALCVRSRFVEGVMLATQDGCSVCPALARVFPSPLRAGLDGGEGSCSACADQDQWTDVFIGGGLDWGIHLRVRVHQTGIHTHDSCDHASSPFGSHGRYAVLAVRDYKTVVIDANNG